MRCAAIAENTRSLTQALSVRKGRVWAADLAACLLAAVVAGGIFPTRDGGDGSCIRALARSSISAAQPGGNANARVLFDPAMAEIEISFDEVEPGHESAYSWPLEDHAGPCAARCRALGLLRAGVEPAVLAANAADLSRLCRLLI